MSSVTGARTTALWLDRLDPPVVARPGLDCHLTVDVAIVGGGYSGLWTAYYLRRLDPGLRIAVEHHRALGFTADEIRLLDAAEATTVANATKVRSGIFFAPSAVLDPARLVRGLVGTVEALGVAVYEQTEVTAIGPGRVETTGGTVRAEVIVRATEAYTRDLPGARRHLIPVYSLMVATEPLDETVFDQIGLADRPSFADDRYLVILSWAFLVTGCPVSLSIRGPATGRSAAMWGRQLRAT